MTEIIQRIKKISKGTFRSYLPKSVFFIFRSISDQFGKSCHLSIMRYLKRGALSTIQFTSRDLMTGVLIFPSVLPLAGIFAEKYEPREKSKCPARPKYKTLILHCVEMSDFLKNNLGISKFEKLLPESFVEVA